MTTRRSLYLLLAEALRTGRQQLVPQDFYRGRLSGHRIAAFRYAARKAGLVQHAISKRWIPGPLTYGFIERYIAHRVYFRREFTKPAHFKELPCITK